MSTLEKQIEKRLLSVPLLQALSGAEGLTLQAAEKLLNAGELAEHFTPWHDEIRRKAPQVQACLRDALHSHDPLLRASPHFYEPDPFIDGLEVEPAKEYCDPDSLQSQLSQARYLWELYEMAKELTYEKKQYRITERRVDLASLALSEDNLKREVSTLSLANEVMMGMSIKPKAGAIPARDETTAECYERLSTSREAFSLPYNLCQTSVRLGLNAQNKNNLNRIARLTQQEENALSSVSYSRVPNAGDRLKLCDEDISILRETAVGDIKYRQVGNFLSYTGLSADELNQMLCLGGISQVNGAAGRVNEHYAWYINAGQTSAVKVARNGAGTLVLMQGNSDAPLDVVGNMLRMARLYRRTGLPFHVLDHLIKAACQLAGRPSPLLDISALKLIAGYLEWQERYGIPVEDWVGLLSYSSPWYRNDLQETAYLSQVYGVETATWIARYAGAVSGSGDVRYLIGAPGGASQLTPDEIGTLQLTLRLTPEEWSTVTALVSPSSRPRVFDWACLAALHRFSLLFHEMGWPVDEAITMLQRIAPDVLNTMAGGNSLTLLTALDKLAWLDETLDNWQVSPGSLQQMVSEATGSTQETQETVDWLNALYQNIQPLQLTAEMFSGYQEVVSDNTDTSPPPSATIDWLTELQKDEPYKPGEGGKPATPVAVAPVDPFGLVKTVSRSELEAFVRIVMARHNVTNALTTQGVTDLLLRMSQNAEKVLDVSVFQATDDDSTGCLPLLLAWMGHGSSPRMEPISVNQVLNTLLSVHLHPGGSSGRAPRGEIDLVTLNASTQVEIRRLIGELRRYTRTRQTFHLVYSDMQLLAEQKVIFTSVSLMPLDFNMLLALSQLKFVQNSAAPADKWYAYFVSCTRAGVENDESAMTALKETLRMLLACESDELTALLAEQVGLAGRVPSGVSDLAWMSRKLKQARTLQLDYQRFQYIRAMANEDRFAPPSQIWTAQQRASEAVIGSLRNAALPLTQLVVPLEEANRDALVGYLLEQRLGEKNIQDIKTAEQLYSYLLMDVNVSGGVLTTRMTEAISSVQLAIQRATEGVEAITNGAQSKADLLRRWSESYPYALWRARQELTMFPDHYVDPSLLQKSSVDYQDFMAALEQGRLSDESVRAALEPYMGTLSARGRAIPGNMVFLPGDHKTTRSTLWLTACPSGDSNDWHWRELTLTPEGVLEETTPWDRINTVIPRDGFSVPSVLRVNGTMNAVWVECSERPLRGSDGQEGPDKYVYCLRRARRAEDGGWGEPEVLSIDAVSYTEVGVGSTCRQFAPVPEMQGVQEVRSSIGMTVPYYLGSCWLGPEKWMFSLITEDDLTSTPTKGLSLKMLVDAGQFRVQYCAKEDGVRNPLKGMDGRRMDAITACLYRKDREFSRILDDSGQPVTIKSSLFIPSNSYGDASGLVLRDFFEWLLSYEIVTVEGAGTWLIDSVSLQMENINAAPLTLYQGNQREKNWCWGGGEIKYPIENLPYLFFLEQGLKIKVTFSKDKETKTVEEWMLPPYSALSEVTVAFPLFAGREAEPSWTITPTPSLQADKHWLFEAIALSKGSSAATDETSSFDVTSGKNKLIYQGFPVLGLNDGAGSPVFAVVHGGVNQKAGGAFSLSCLVGSTSHEEVLLLAVYEDSLAKSAWLKVQIRYLDSRYVLRVTCGEQMADVILAPEPLEVRPIGLCYSQDAGLQVWELGSLVNTLSGVSLPPALTTIEILGRYMTGMGPMIGDLKLYRRALTGEEMAVMGKPRTIGRSVRLSTRMVCELQGSIQPVAGETPFLYRASNYATLQSLPEPDMHQKIVKYRTLYQHSFLSTTGLPSVPFDFSGIDGGYGWELFLYMPWLIAQRFMSKGEYEKARWWLQRIFNPTQKEEEQRWPCRPLRVSSLSPSALSPGDPNAIARATPAYYRTAIQNTYVQLLTDAGDAQYRHLTRESLSQAKMYYVMAKDLIATDQQILDNLQFLQVSSWTSPALGVASAGNFLRPLDEMRSRRWNILQERLDNLRHQRSIDGVPVNLPLQPPRIDPRRVQQSAASSGSRSSLNAQQEVPIPHYRFSVMLEKSRSFVTQLSALGSTLQQVLERDDAEVLGQLQQQQQIALLQLGQSMQLEQIAMATHQLEALQISRRAQDGVYNYYQRLHDEGISEPEQTAMDLLTSAGAIRAGASTSFVVAAALDTIPNIYGTAVGGARYGAVAQAVGQGLLVASEVMQTGADRLLSIEQYRRRSEDWQLQYEQADLARRSLDAQIAGATRALDLANKELQQQELQQAQAQATMTLLQQRFSSRALYQWQGSRLTSLYWQAYDLAASLCRQTEAACQYELGDFGLSFIQTGHAWDNSFRGLLAGESLLLGLQRMERAFQQKNVRQLEIIKTLSLKALDSAALALLKSTGVVSFALTETLFNSDYPNHYLRRIKSVSLSFPALLGPYQEVGAELTQTSNRLYYTREKNKTSSKQNLRALQQVALSQGLNDSGLFQMDFNDERYLPFEGTGVESTWRLSFPGYKPGDTSTPTRKLLDSLDDVIIQIRYYATPDRSPSTR